jgi:RHS repeat-associated protein
MLILIGKLKEEKWVTDKIMQEITSMGTINYDYDAIGRRTKMTVAGQPEVNYSYDANSRLINVGATLSGRPVDFGISYDAVGRRTSLILPNGVTTNYNYDNGNRLLTLEHLNPLNSILEKLTYTYDKNGNRESMDRQNVSVKLPSPVSNTSYNSANQLLTFNDKNISYDANGNMDTITNSCGTTNYTWNARNQLTAINGFNADCSSLIAAFKYDALGRRIEKTVNGKTKNYLYDGLDIVQEIESGTVTANYIRTLNIDEPLARITSDGTIRYYQQDALGSVIALTDEDGNIKTQYQYDPFGNTSFTGEESDNPFQYTGRENNGTGLYYYRARYYSSELQRFISEDPIRFDGGDVNFYAYVGNNPVNFVDPLGLFGITGPGFSNLRPEGSKPGCKDPYDECIENANKFRETCTKLLWVAQAKCTAICAVACVGSTAGYPACLASCAYACHRGFALGRAGCWATYAAMLEACRRSQ